MTPTLQLAFNHIDQALARNVGNTLTPELLAGLFNVIVQQVTKAMEEPAMADSHVDSAG